MPRFGPIRRADLVRYLRELGFAGPLPGTKHEIMVKGALKLRIPNPHQGDISKGLLMVILREAGIDRKVWEKL